MELTTRSESGSTFNYSIAGDKVQIVATSPAGSTKTFTTFKTPKQVKNGKITVVFEGKALDLPCFEESKVIEFLNAAKGRKLHTFDSIDAMRAFEADHKCGTFWFEGQTVKIYEYI